ncbi:MAG TPA: SMP-30/gluconolactonase/LRE family protein [Nitrospiraceae bacterium]|nr:SMP-30/gluconolactonase/LRE family protein [Nitrospiraceae bacterium]
MPVRIGLLSSLLLIWVGAMSYVPALARPQVLDQKPDATIDLMAQEGVALVKGRWRYSDTKIVEVDHRGVGPDLAPSGPPNRTYDLVPHAGAGDFDDSGWQVLDAPDLEARRSTGRLCFNWYRIAVTVPERIGHFDPTGSTVVFEIVIDDYAEIWVNGTLPLVLGQTGGQVIKGFNAPNRVILTRQARPGDRFQLAVLGANGPLSKPPGNFIWVRSASLDFYAPSRFEAAHERGGGIVRVDPALDELISPTATAEKLAGGFSFTEGPVWVPGKDGVEGYLLFSVPNDNLIYRMTVDGEVSVFRTKSGYAGFDIGGYHQPGSNGLTLDRQGRLTINQHGNRRVIRVEPHGDITVLADRFEGKRLNSPNDLVYKSDGSLYFTDPPFGLPKAFDDPRKELPFSGVYRVADGKIDLVADDLDAPNGIAFSPDERFLYVNNWNEKKKVIMRYEVRPDGRLANGRVFFDMTAAPGEDALDGMKVDVKGNVYCTGPGGIWIISPHGRHLGTVQLPENPHNLAWGDDDGNTLYVTALSGIYKIRTRVAGVRPGPQTGS